MLERVWRKRNLSTLLVGMLVKPLWKTIWKFLKNLKIDLPYGPAIPLLGIYREKTTIQKTHAPSIPCSTIYKNQDMEATEMSISRGMDKEDVVHIYHGIVLSH